MLINVFAILSVRVKKADSVVMLKEKMKELSRYHNKSAAFLGQKILIVSADLTNKYKRKIS